MQSYFAAGLLLFLNLNLKVTAAVFESLALINSARVRREKGFWRVPGTPPLIYNSNVMILGFERIPPTLIFVSQYF